MILAAGMLSSSIAQFAAYPLALTRTRLQAQGIGGKPIKYAGMGDVLRKTVANEGVRGLYKVGGCVFWGGGEARGREEGRGVGGGCGALCLPRGCVALLRALWRAVGGALLAVGGEGARVLLAGPCAGTVLRLPGQRRGAGIQSLLLCHPALPCL